jgi:regulator of RNase E activity RraA
MLWELLVQYQWPHRPLLIAVVISQLAQWHVKRPAQTSKSAAAWLQAAWEEKMTTLPRDETARFELVANSLYTPVIGDILDGLGRTHQFLPAAVQPLLPSMTVVGRAMPVLIADVFDAGSKPFGKLTEALDALQPGDVYLARRATIACAAWGEIMTAAARKRCANGAVIDGYHRDTPKVLEQNWPVFSRGAYAQDAGVRAAVLDFGVPVEIYGARINPGDLIVGDCDGVLAVPAEIEDEVLELALKKASTENDVRKAIEDGMTTTEAFARYCVL